MTLEDTARHEKTREGTARHEKARQGTRRHGKAREGTARHEKSRQGTRRHGHEGTECFLLIEPTTNDAVMPYSSISFKHSIIQKCEIKMDLEKTCSAD